jgi:hypothetical protein
LHSPRPSEIEEGLLSGAVSLTNDYGAVRLGLSRIRERGASGADFLPASLDRCTGELLGLDFASSSSTGGGRRVILILWNGLLVLPYGPDHSDENARAAIRAVDRARVAGVHLYEYILPLVPNMKLLWLNEMTQKSGGVLTVVSKPSELIDSVSRFSVPAN